MEEMNKGIVENTVTDIVEESVDNLTFGENVIAYGVAAVFMVGLVTTTYLGYKGGKLLVNKIKEKRERSKESEQYEVVAEYEEEETSSDQE